MTPEELLAEHDSLLRMLDDHAAVSMLQKDNAGILFTVLANTFSAERIRFQPTCSRPRSNVALNTCGASCPHRTESAEPSPTP